MCMEVCARCYKVTKSRSEELVFEHEQYIMLPNEKKKETERDIVKIYFMSELQEWTENIFLFICI